MSAPQSWLTRQAQDRPQEIALLYGPRQISFERLNRAVDAYAAGLHRHPPAVHSLPAADPMLALVAALAAPRAGLAFHPLSAFRPRPLAWRDRTEANPLPPEAVQLIVSTSGSSSQSKAVMLTGRNIAAAVTASAKSLPLRPGNLWLCCLPLAAIGGLSVPFRCLQAGATVSLQAGFDPQAVAQALQSQGVSHLSLVPAMLDRLLDHGVQPPRSLNAVLVGGAALSASLADRALAAGWPVHPSYGMSETASQIATCNLSHDWQPGLAGRPLPGFEIAFAANRRLRLRGPQLMAGYANPDLQPGDGLDTEGWLETGDVGYRSEDGQLWIQGRGDEVLNSGGVSLHPSEIETVLSSCPLLDKFAVSGRGDACWGDVIVLFHTGPSSAAAVMDWCARHVPSPMRPRRVLHIPALPLNSAGKLDRRALRAIAASLPE